MHLKISLAELVAILSGGRWENFNLSMIKLLNP